LAAWLAVAGVISDKWFAAAHSFLHRENVAVSEIIWQRGSQPLKLGFMSALAHRSLGFVRIMFKIECGALHRCH